MLLSDAEHHHALMMFKTNGQGYNPMPQRDSWANPQDDFLRNNYPERYRELNGLNGARRWQKIITLRGAVNVSEKSWSLSMESAQSYGQVQIELSGEANCNPDRKMFDE
jgi:hypothetical protein